MTVNSYIKRFSLNLVDSITILYILATLILLMAGAGSYNDAASHYLVRIGMLLFVFLMAFTAKRYPGKLTDTLHYLYPFIFLSYFFRETDYLNNLFSDELDTTIIYLENRILGFMPSKAFSTCFPQAWVSELMHAGYFSYYFIMVFFVVYYTVKLPQLAAVRISTLYLSFYLFYLIFIFFPSAGPQYFLPPAEAVVPKGYFFTAVMNKILLYGDGATGAFPSSHVGITWLIMYFYYRDRKKLFYLWVVPALVLTLSTVYIKAHYAADVVAAFLIVPVFNRLGRIVYSWYTETFDLPEKKYSSS